MPDLSRPSALHDDLLRPTKRQKINSTSFLPKDSTTASAPAQGNGSIFASRIFNTVKSAWNADILGKSKRNSSHGAELLESKSNNSSAAKEQKHGQATSPETNRKSHGQNSRSRGSKKPEEQSQSLAEERGAVSSGPGKGKVKGRLAEHDESLMQEATNSVEKRLRQDNANHTPTKSSSSAHQSRGWKGWAKLDDDADIPLNNQDEFAQIALQAARAAAEEQANEDDARKQTSAKSLRIKRERRSTEAGRSAQELEHPKPHQKTGRNRGPKSPKTNGRGLSKGDRISKRERTEPLERKLDVHADRHASEGDSDAVSSIAVEAQSDGFADESRTAENGLESSRTSPSAAVTLANGEDIFDPDHVTKTHREPRRAAKGFSRAQYHQKQDLSDQANDTVHAQKVKTAFDVAAVKLQKTITAQLPAFDTIKTHVLENLTGRRNLGVPAHVADQFQKVHQLLSQTILAGEGNSMLIIGPRGSGKTALVENAISDLNKMHHGDFYTVRLNGFIHTDDKLALRDIWRQLGHELDAEQEEKAVRSNYADTLISILALLSHEAEAEGQPAGSDATAVVTKSIIFVLEEFDLFATHPRQTLLYNLFDVAQSHRNAPVAVLGLTTRVNVVDNLEKRVKSRFGQRYVHLSLPPNPQTFKDICFTALSLPAHFHEDVAGPVHDAWKNYISALLDEPLIQTYLNRVHHTTNRPSDFFVGYLLPIISALTPSTLFDSFSDRVTLLAPPDSNLHLLPSLSTLQLCLLIAAARLDIIMDTDIVSFDTAYAEYVSLASKAKVHAGIAGGVAGGIGRVWGREVALQQWEGLTSVGLALPAAGASSMQGGTGSGAASLGRGLGGGGSGAGTGNPGTVLWKVDVGLEEIGAWLEQDARHAGYLSAGLATGLGKWCREI